MSSYLDVSHQILEAVGGKENVTSVTHCVTRLRLTLADKKKCNEEIIKKIDSVQGIIHNSNQLQIILGLSVSNYYDEFIKLIDKNKSKSISNFEIYNPRQNWIKSLLKIFPAVLGPLVPLITGTGIILALMTIIAVICQQGFNIDISKTIWNQIFYGMGLLFAAYITMHVCITASKYWKVNLYYAVSIGIFLTFQKLTGELIPNWAIFDNSAPATQSLFTALVAIKIAQIVEKFLNKKIHENIKMFIVPTLTIAIPIIFILFIFGPIIHYVEFGLREVSKWLTGPTLHGFGNAILGCFFAPLVITGMHHIMTPIIQLNLFPEGGGIGHDPLTMVQVASNIAQAAAAIGMFFVLKDKKEKSVAISAGLTAVAGITEPAMFAVNMRHKSAFISAMFGAFCGSLYYGITQTEILGSGGSPGILSPIFSIPNPSNPLHNGFTIMNTAHTTIGILISFGITLFLTIFFGKIFKKIENKNKENKILVNLQIIKSKIGEKHYNLTHSKFFNKYLDIKAKVHFFFEPEFKNDYYYNSFEKLHCIKSPLKGKYIKIEKMDDVTFASGSMGKGFAIDPEKGLLKAPFNGEVTMIFATRHAIGLKSNDGIELLIHIGIDSVKLDGKGFKALVEEGKKVKLGQPLLKFNVKKLKKAGISTQSAIIITNSEKFKSNIRINELKMNQPIEYGENIINIKGI